MQFLCKKKKINIFVVDKIINLAEKLSLSLIGLINLKFALSKIKSI